IGASYAFDDITVHANYGAWDWGLAAARADANGFGLAAGYNLGGGLNALLGYQSSEVTALNASVGATLGTTSTWSLGLAMSF
ncbi:MAG TPA: porin, partial [Roseibacterium sp.]|nr:porin [Roseibacterium sp.]